MRVINEPIVPSQKDIWYRNIPFLESEVLKHQGRREGMGIVCTKEDVPVLQLLKSNINSYFFVLFPDVSH